MRRLGRTGFKVNVLGLGGHVYPVGHGPDCFASPDTRAQLVRHLVSSGVNYFDTTYIEEVELLADSFKRADIKEDVVISLYGGSLADRQWRQRLRHEIEARLDLLGYTRAPLLLISVGNGEASYGDVVAVCEAMMKLKEEKLAHNIGVSCHAINLFPLISRAIRETDIIDYMMIRFNWKYQQANEELFPVAGEHDVGIVGMKLFCWDCGPSQWERRISVFEPVNHEQPVQDNPVLTTAQRHLLWCIHNSSCDVVVPSMNTMQEAEENIRALRSVDVKVDTEDFETYGERLWNKEEIKKLALYAESKTIRERAEFILKPRRPGHILIRTVYVHFKILKNEGVRKYILYSYHYRTEQFFNWVKRALA